MSGEDSFGAFAGILAIGLTCYWHFTAPAPPKPGPEIGRFQIVRQGDLRSFLVDTATGDTFSWVFVSQPNGKTVEEWQHDNNDTLATDRMSGFAPQYTK